MSTLFEQAVAITKAHADLTAPRYPPDILETCPKIMCQYEHDPVWFMEHQKCPVCHLKDRVYDLETQLRESEAETEDTREQLSDLRRRRH